MFLNLIPHSYLVGFTFFLMFLVSLTLSFLKSFVDGKKEAAARISVTLYTNIQKLGACI